MAARNARFDFVGVFAAIIWRKDYRLGRNPVTHACRSNTLLLGLNLARQPVFALVLLGDNYLQDTLRLQQHKALYSRLSVQCQLHTLDRSQVEAYLVHGLRQVGLDRPCLHPAALELLASASSGVPRLVNLLARAAWIAAAQAHLNTIGPEQVQAARELVPAARDRLHP